MAPQELRYKFFTQMQKKLHKKFPSSHDKKLAKTCLCKHFFISPKASFVYNTNRMNVFGFVSYNLIFLFIIRLIWALLSRSHSTHIYTQTWESEFMHKKIPNFSCKKLRIFGCNFVSYRKVVSYIPLVSALLLVAPIYPIFILKERERERERERECVCVCSLSHTWKDS